jgi:hypothetical protein
LLYCPPISDRGVHRSVGLTSTEASTRVDSPHHVFLAAANPTRLA